MRKAASSHISTSLYSGVVMFFGVPLVLLMLLGWYQLQAQTISRSVAGFGNDLSVFDAIRIDSRYSRWKGSLDSFVADPRPETYAAFSSVDQEWQQQLYDLSAAATGPELTAALQQTEKSRTDVLQTTDALAETAAFLTDAEQKIILAQTDAILKRLQAIRERIPATAPEQVAFISEIAVRFRDGVISAMQFVRNPDAVIADKARQDFLWIAENLGQMQPATAVATQIEEVRKDLSTFYTAFEQIVTTAANQSNLRNRFSDPTMVDKVRLVNPLAGSNWSRSLESVENGSLDRMFMLMRILATAGVVVLCAGLVYSLLYIRAGFLKPLNALASFCAHAYLTRRRMPVPATDRKDEIGSLARAVQAMLERLHQQYAITDEMPKSVSVTADHTTTALPVDAMPAYVVGRLEQLEERARDTGGLALALAETIEQRALLATDSARESEHSRARLQEACVALRDIKDVIGQIDTMSEHMLNDIRRSATARDRLTIRQRNAQMTVMRLSQAVEALNGMAEEVNLLVQKTRMTISDLDHEARRAVVSSTLAQLAHHLEETCIFFRLETVTLAEAMRQTFGDDVEGLASEQAIADAETLQQRAAWCRSTLLDHFARLQEAAFVTGQQALQMLETSGSFVRIGVDADRLRQRAQDLADECGNLRRSMLYRDVSASAAEADSGPDAVTVVSPAPKPVSDLAEMSSSDSADPALGNSVGAVSPSQA